ncbi:MAG: nucleotidyltransferase domain-containing protein [Chloroflexi bacterium]|nr:nucleotidyltransferase domain-containing protein [Chloroflexota bacterium]
MATALSEVLSEVKQALTEALGEQLIAVRLFGSYARGEERADSDIDLLVLVRQIDDYGDLIRRTSATVADISLRHDVVISRAFAVDGDYRRQQTPFFMNVRRESVPV